MNQYYENSPNEYFVNFCYEYFVNICYLAKNCSYLSLPCTDISFESVTFLFRVRINVATSSALRM